MLFKGTEFFVFYVEEVYVFFATIFVINAQRKGKMKELSRMLYVNECSLSSQVLLVSTICLLLAVIKVF